MGNLHLRFDEGRAGRATRVAFSPTLPTEARRSYEPKPKHPLKENQGRRGEQTASRWSASELQNLIKKGDPSGAGRFAPLQAHSSMRECSMQTMQAVA